MGDSMRRRRVFSSVSFSSLFALSLAATLFVLEQESACEMKLEKKGVTMRGGATRDGRRRKSESQCSASVESSESMASAFVRHLFCSLFFFALQKKRTRRPFSSALLFSFLPSSPMPPSLQPLLGKSANPAAPSPKRKRYLVSAIALA